MVVWDFLEKNSMNVSVSEIRKRGKRGNDMMRHVDVDIMDFQIHRLKFISVNLAVPT